MIVKDLQPVSMVEDAGFCHFMKVVDSRYNIPFRKSLMTTEIKSQNYTERLHNTCKQCGFNE